MTSADRMPARQARLGPVMNHPGLTSPVQDMNWHSWTANDGVQALALLALLSYCVTAAITGPFRWAVGLVGLTPIIYFPQILMLGSTLAVVVWESRQGLQPLRAMTLLVISYSILVGLFHTPVYQVLFGIYTLLPFWFVML